MKKIEFNINLLLVFAFALLTILAHLTKSSAVEPLFGTCTMIFLVLLIFNNKTK